MSPYPSPPLPFPAPWCTGLVSSFVAARRRVILAGPNAAVLRDGALCALAEHLRVQPDAQVAWAALHTSHAKVAAGRVVESSAASASWRRHLLTLVGSPRGAQVAPLGVGQAAYGMSFTGMVVDLAEGLPPGATVGSVWDWLSNSLLTRLVTDSFCVVLGVPGTGPFDELRARLEVQRSGWDFVRLQS